jgi:hypothetical protein
LNLLLRRLADIALISKSGFSICKTASTCIMAVLILMPALAVCRRGWNGNSITLERTQKSQLLTNDLDCDPSIRRHRTTALAKR